MTLQCYGHPPTGGGRSNGLGEGKGERKGGTALNLREHVEFKPPHHLHTRVVQMGRCPRLCQFRPGHMLNNQQGITGPVPTVTGLPLCYNLTVPYLCAFRN